MHGPLFTRRRGAKRHGGEDRCLFSFQGIVGKSCVQVRSVVGILFVLTAEERRNRETLYRYL
jgi:hypothetical protein